MKQYQTRQRQSRQSIACVSNFFAGDSPFHRPHTDRGVRLQVLHICRRNLFGSRGNGWMHFREEKCPRTLVACLGALGAYSRILGAKLAPGVGALRDRLQWCGEQPPCLPTLDGGSSETERALEDRPRADRADYSFAFAQFFI